MLAHYGDTICAEDVKGMSEEYYPRLWQAVIEQALYDATWEKKAHPEYMRESLDWFFSPLQEEDFLHVCALAVRSPVKMRIFLRNLLDQGKLYRRRKDKE